MRSFPRKLAIVPCLVFVSGLLYFSAEAGSSPSACKTTRVSTAYFPDNQDQRMSGTCFAYGYANFLSFYTRQKISPIGIAARSYIQDSRASSPKLEHQFLSASGPNLTSVVQAHHSIRKNFCAESNFKVNALGWSKEMDWYLELERQLRLAQEVTLDGVSLKNSLHLAQAIDKKCVDNVAIPQGQFLDHENSGALLYSPMEGRERRLIDFSEMLIHRWLDKEEPVLITYFAKFLVFENAGLDGLHSSVLIGRQFNRERQQCELLIKNSWGKDCSMYIPRLQESCENGDVWVSEDELYQYLAKYTVFLRSQNSIPSLRTCDYRDAMGTCCTKAEWDALFE